MAQSSQHFCVFISRKEEKKQVQIFAKYSNRHFLFYDLKQNSPEEKQAIAQEMASLFYDLSYQWHEYGEEPKDLFFQKEFEEQVFNYKYLAYTALSHCTELYKNVFSNFLDKYSLMMKHTYACFFKEQACIICGSGPSLEKELSWIRDMMDQALLLCGGTSIKALQKKSLAPHIHLLLHPYDKLLRDFKEAFIPPIPSLYRLKTFYGYTQKIEGIKACLWGCANYDIQAFFDQHWKEEKKVEIQEGSSVTHLAIELAFALGCSPIILAGVDLSMAQPSKNAMIPLQSRQGNTVFTNINWLQQKKWLDLYAKNYPLLCTENSPLSFQGIPCMSHEEIKKKYFKKKRNLHGQSHSFLCQSQSTLASDEIFSSLLSSLWRCKEIYSNCLKSVYEKQEQKEIEDLQELRQEEAYIYILKELHERFVASTLRERKLFYPSYSDTEKLKRYIQDLKYLEEAAGEVHHCLKICMQNASKN